MILKFKVCVLELVILMGKRRNKFGGLGHKLPQMMLSYKILKGEFVSQSAGILEVGKVRMC